MKNFETILQDVKKVALTQYERGFDCITLALANMLNKNLRRLIVKQGKNPDGVVVPSVPMLTEAEIIKSAVSNELQKRAARPFSFAGTPNADWVKNEEDHPILKSRKDFEDKVKSPGYTTPFSEVLMDLPVEAPADLPSPPPDVEDLINQLEVKVKKILKKKSKPGKKRYSLSTGKLLDKGRSR